MNIFFLSEDSKEAAQMQVDKHIVKMPLEAAQMLCTAHRLLDENTNPILYKSTHIHHPCSKWARESLDNYVWLYWHFVHLCDEYTYRYGRKHLTDIKLREALRCIPKNIPNIGFTSPAQAMPEEYKHTDPVIAYRSYYKNAKKSFAKWSGREMPEWYTCAKIINMKKGEDITMMY